MIPQESLYDTKDIAPSKKASKKCDTFKNTQTNELVKADDIFYEMIAVHLKNMNEGTAEEFEIRYSPCCHYCHSSQ